MFSRINRKAATAASLALLLTPVAANYPQEFKDRKLRQCDSSVKFADVTDMGGFWGDDAEKFANDYINANTDHSQWAQNLYRDLFSSETARDFDCMGPDAPCSISVTCNDFNAIDKGSLYYLFVSMMNYHAYMKALRNEMNFAFIQNSLSVGTIQEILHLPDGKADEPLNIFAILSGATAVAAAIPLNPAWQGATAAASGVFAIAGELAPQPEAADVTGKASAAITNLIKNSAESTNEIISQLIGAVFGRQGQSQDIIPQSMRRGGVSNPAVSVFGYGTWLQDNGGTIAAQTLVKTMKAKADQSLLWQMARLFKRTYVLVRPDLDATECTDAVNAWDTEKNQCYTLHSWDGTTSGTLGGANDLGDMWGRWNMDPMWTMRNAVECWEANDGKIGQASITQGWTSSAPPPCFFAMTVLKGSYSDIMKGTLWLDGNFAGQKGMQDKLWPKNKCEEQALEYDAEECDYDWKEFEAPE